ncbi:MAG: hypothetical protein JSS51_07620 [Planctomycetes bacterium]|nr:hypothetical protein [Planctomycetota bacterium]
MNPNIRKPVDLGRALPGEGFLVPTPRFGPMFANQIRLQAEVNRRRLIDFPHIGSENDQIIIRAFEKLRKGLSVDRFLCDPALSKRLQRECAGHGLVAPEPAINLRLLAIRKSAGHGTLKQTDRPTAARDIVERLGLGVEAAMRHIALRFGASVDDMLAHPEIGKVFVDFARRIIRGGSEIEYRLCALQIRKGRHISGVYDEKVAELNMRMVAKRWESIGSPREALWKNAPLDAGIVELRAADSSLYVLRTRHIAASLQETFSPESVERVLRSDYFSEIKRESTSLRFLPKKQLPAGTPKAWELFLIHELQPRFNWPVTQEAA